MSPELVVTAAGEAEAPRRNIPKAANRFIYRLFAFYVLGTLVIGVTVAYNDKGLLNAINNGEHAAGASPFVIAVQNAGIKGLNHVINAAILTSAWSSGNAWLFSGSRMLYSLALTDQAPKIFLRCNKNGVPWVAVLFTFAFGCLAFLNVSSNGATVFNWFTNITTISGFIAWIVVLITYLRFRKAMIFHNMLDALPFRTPFQPYSCWFSLVVMVLVTLTNGFYVFVPSRWNISDFLVCYVTIPIFLVLWFGHKVWSKNWRWCIPIKDVDVWSGKDLADAEELEYEVREPRNMLEKIWFWVV
jgi:amino acid transporter